MVASPPFPSPLLPPFSRSPSPPRPSSHSPSLSPRLLRQEKLNPELVVPFLYARCREARSLPNASQGRDTRPENKDEQRGRGGGKREWTNERKGREGKREIGNGRYFCNGRIQRDECNARKTRVRASCFLLSFRRKFEYRARTNERFFVPYPRAPAEIETFERCTCGARRIVTRPRFEFQPILSPLSFYSAANHIC